MSLFLATGVVILHILSWRDREHKERRQARNICVAIDVGKEMWPNNPI